MNINVLKESNDSVDKFTLRSIGAVACWLFWVKVFYWMRLYKKFAPYVTLIISVVKELEVFFVMLLIIGVSFGNAFYILNNNTSANPNNTAATDPMFAEEFEYVPNNLNNPVLDNILNMWLLSLGEFNLDGLPNGPTSKLAWLFFFGASFMNLTVFMNMLIIIISDVFTNVQSSLEETRLQE